MKKKFKPLLWIVVLAMSMLLITVFSLGGCKAAEETAAEEVEEAAEEEPVAEEAEAEEPVTISLAMHVANVKDQEPATYAIVQEFMKNNPNITVEIQGTETDEHIKKMKMMAASGTLPDVFWMLPPPAKEMAEAGYLGDLTEFLSNNEDVVARIPANMIDAYKLDDGTQYGIAYQPLVTGLWVNNDILGKYGLQVPETFDELKEVVKTLKENDVVTIAKGAKSPFSVWAFLIMICRYGYFDKIDGILAGEASYNNPDFLKFYQKIDELRELGAFPENVSTLDYFQAVEMFMAGNAAMLDAGVWEAPKVEASEFGAEASFWFGPTFGDGVGNQKVSMAVPAAPFVVSASVMEDQAKANAVFEFLKYYFSDEAADIIVNSQFLPVIKYSGEIDTTSGLGKVLEALGKPDWVSPPNQPDLIVSEAIGNAMYDSIYGVINGVYTPEEALDIVDSKIAEQ